MSTVNGIPNFLLYQPQVAQVGTAGSETTTVTPNRWQDQMGHMVNLFESAPAVAAAPLEKTKEVPEVPGRDGKVLKADTFLKADQYPGLHHTSLQAGPHPQPVVEGAPNYREVGEKIYGTAQPTVEGIKNVLNRAGSGPGQNGKQAIWTDLRQEPVVYVNGKPFNLRNVKAPFYNQEAPGRTPAETEKVEHQLKQDILDEAKRNGGYITLHDEAKGMPPRVVETRFKVDQVQTLDEVYGDLQKQGYNVKYQRIPVTDMQKPQDKDIDALVSSLKGADPDAPLIFNCHAGEGRTTTGMVMASMMRRGERGDDTPILKDGALRDDIKEQGDHNPANYRAILQAVKDADKLQGTQAEADAVINRYGDVHNLKEAVGKARGAAESAKTPEERATDLKRQADYLDRYHTVLSFESYSKELAPDYKMSYSDWKKAHPQLQENLDRLQAALTPAPGGPAYA